MPAEKSFFQLLEEKKEQKKILWAPCIYDCISAACAKEVGFEALTISSGEQTNSFAGVPCGLMDFEEMLMSSERICKSTSLPVLVDGENGGGLPELVYKNVKRFAETGAMAISIEDTHSQAIGISFKVPNIYADAKKEIIPVGERYMNADLWATNVKAAVEAVKGTDCMVIARVDSKGMESGIFFKLLGKGLGLDEAIRRAQMGIEAGAPMTMIQSLSCRDGKPMWEEICKRVPGLRCFPDIFSTNGISDIENVQDLYDMGFHMITCHGFQKGAFKGMIEYGRRLIEDQNTVFADTDEFGYNPMWFNPMMWEDYDDRVQTFIDFYKGIHNYKEK